jgi:hypothetical protein
MSDAMVEIILLLHNLKVRLLVPFQILFPQVEILSDLAEKPWIESATLVSGRQVLIV